MDTSVLEGGGSRGGGGCESFGERLIEDEDGGEEGRGAWRVWRG